MHITLYNYLVCYKILYNYIVPHAVRCFLQKINNYRSYHFHKGLYYAKYITITFVNSKDFSIKTSILQNNR